MRNASKASRPREVTKRVKPDFVIVGEATSTSIKIGQRGRAEVVVETEGVSCHSSNPEKGVNAVYGMMAVIEEIRKIVPNEHPLLGRGILELTDIGLRALSRRVGCSGSVPRDV